MSENDNVWRLVPRAGGDRRGLSAAPGRSPARPGEHRGLVLHLC